MIVHDWASTEASAPAGAVKGRAMSWATLWTGFKKLSWRTKRNGAHNGSAADSVASRPLPAGADPHSAEDVGESGWIQYGDLEPTGGARDFAELETRMPALFALLRLDLSRSPAQREFMLAEGAGEFRYGGDRHLADRVRLLVDHGLVMAVGNGEEQRYRLTEEFVHLLTKKPRAVDTA